MMIESITTEKAAASQRERMELYNSAIGSAGEGEPESEKVSFEYINPMFLNELPPEFIEEGLRILKEVIKELEKAVK